MVKANKDAEADGRVQQYEHGGDEHLVGKSP
jgi:hypothetical protein